jgi:hypothetical protein
MKRILTRSWSWFDQFYARFAKVLLILCLLTATGGVIIGTTAQVQSGQAVDANADLVKCLKDWSAETAKVAKATRAAAQEKDEAVTAFNSSLADEGDAFLQLVSALVDPDTERAEYAQLIQRLERTLAVRADANALVLQKQRALDRVREENPIPEPPAIFCQLDVAKVTKEGAQANGTARL